MSLSPVGTNKPLNDSSVTEPEPVKVNESRVPSMVYVDRIVLASDARGQGIGTKLYGYLAELAVGADCQTMTAEMDIYPPNEHSVYFHRKSGFTEIGQRTLESGKQVSMQSVALSHLATL